MNKIEKARKMIEKEILLIPDSIDIKSQVYSEANIKDGIEKIRLYGKRLGLECALEILDRVSGR